MNNATVVEITLKAGTRAQVEGLHLAIAKLFGANSLGVAPGYPATIRERDDTTRLEIEKGFVRAFVLALPDGSFPYPFPSTGPDSSGIGVSSIEYFLESGRYAVRIVGENLARVDGVRLADPLPGVSVSYQSINASDSEIYLTDWRFLSHPPYPAETRSRLTLTVGGDAVFTTEQTIYHQEPN
jgi:hypothetical protein